MRKVYVLMTENKDEALEALLADRRDRAFDAILLDRDGQVLSKGKARLGIERDPVSIYWPRAQSPMGAPPEKAVLLVISGVHHKISEVKECHCGQTHHFHFRVIA